MELPEKTLNIRMRGVSLPASMAFAALFFILGSHANADIYRFVTTDGIESFTDAPIDRNARVIIKSRRAPASGKSGKTRSVKTAKSALIQNTEKSETVSLKPQYAPDNYLEPRLPFVGGIITSGVGMRIDPIDGTWRQHNGIDVAIAEGTPVMPAAPGIVVYSGMRSGYGFTVLVEHAGGLTTLYGHNSKLLAVNGQQVGSGTVIALSGSTGRSTGPHMHFEAWQDGINVTQAFMPENTQKLPIATLASVRTKNHFRKEILADGSLLFSNIPVSTP